MDFFLSSIILSSFFHFSGACTRLGAPLDPEHYLTKGEQEPIA
jgi:hypothetical protein